MLGRRFTSTASLPIVAGVVVPETEGVLVKDLTVDDDGLGTG
jgi:hypothetical protein